MSKKTTTDDVQNTRRHPKHSRRHETFISSMFYLINMNPPTCVSSCLFEAYDKNFRPFQKKIIKKFPTHNVEFCDRICLFFFLSNLVTVVSSDPLKPKCFQDVRRRESRITFLFNLKIKTGGKWDRFSIEGKRTTINFIAFLNNNNNNKIPRRKTFQILPGDLRKDS